MRIVISTTAPMAIRVVVCENSILSYQIPPQRHSGRVIKKVYYTNCARGPSLIAHCHATPAPSQWRAHKQRDKHMQPPCCAGRRVCSNEHMNSSSRKHVSQRGTEVKPAVLKHGEQTKRPSHANRAYRICDCHCDIVAHYALCPLFTSIKRLA